MISYTVKYKRKGQWFWRKIQNVIEDGGSLLTESSTSYRWFLTERKMLIIIPAENTLFEFTAERADMIDEREVLKKKAEENA